MTKKYVYISTTPTYIYIYKSYIYIYMAWGYIYISPLGHFGSISEVVHRLHENLDGSILTIEDFMFTRD